MSDLIRMHSKYKGENNKKKAGIVGRILKYEMKMRCFKKLDQINNPENNEGGITHIIIERNDKQIRIEEKEQVLHHLHERNVNNFSQGKNKPCASGELYEILGEDGWNTNVTRLFNGEELEGTPMGLQDFLKEFKQKRGTMSYNIPFYKMIDGFAKWRETTTTSPSGKHLGIYKTLKELYKENDNEKTTQKEKENDNNTGNRINNFQETSTTA
jgi:hypothetical protein